MRKQKKQVTLAPDNRKEFYSEFEDFLLVNSDLILLLCIFGVLIVIIFIMIINAQFFQSPYILLNGGI